MSVPALGKRHCSSGREAWGPQGEPGEGKPGLRKARAGRNDPGQRDGS